jgi:hypothetical protein
MPRGNLAWVAWRKGDLSQALAQGKAALELGRQSQSAFPFQWLYLTLLLAVALADDQISEAVEYARGLLEPAQHRLPDTLETTLEGAIEMWEIGEPEAARTYFDRTIQLAQEMGYL